MSEEKPIVEGMKLPRQSVNLLRQVLSAPSWAKTTSDFYLAGKMLTQKIPELDLDWVRTAEQQSKMSAEELVAYKKQDREFASAMITLTPFSKKETDVIRRCLEKNVEHMGNGKYPFALFEAFDFQPE